MISRGDMERRRQMYLEEMEALARRRRIEDKQVLAFAVSAGVLLFLVVVGLLWLAHGPAAVAAFLIVLWFLAGFFGLLYSIYRFWGWFFGRGT